MKNQYKQIYFLLLLVIGMCSKSMAQNSFLTVKPGSSLTVNDATIKIGGSVSSSGTFNVTNGTIEMNGPSAQTIGGSMFYNRAVKNLIVSNTGTGLTVSSTLNDTLKITGVLSFGNPSTILNTGDNITLVSNDAGTARVGIVGNENAIIGKVAVERYINTGTAAGQHAKSWQFLATPTSGQTVKESWMENGLTTNNYGAMITGPAGVAAGFDIASVAPSMKYYNYLTNNWIGISNTNNPIADSRGYMVFVRGDRTVTASNQPANQTVLRTKGKLYTGTLPPLTVPLDNFQSIGNPYASPIDFTLISKDAAVDDKFYVWDPWLYGTYGAGGYQTISAVNNWKPVPGGTVAYPSNVANTIIQSGQAFFVHSTSSHSFAPQSSTFTFMENCKSAGTGSTKFSRMAGDKANQTRQFLRASLLTNNGLMADGNVVAFDKTYSDDIDGNDALKILNSGENFTVKSAGKLLAVDAKSPVSASDTIFYYISNLSKITYKLIFAPENMQSAGVQAFLIDKFLKTETPFSLTDSSFFNINVTSDAASSASGRFQIVFRQLASLPVTITSITATAKDADNLLQWNVANENSIWQYEVEKSTDGSQFNQLAVVNAANNGKGNYTATDKNVSNITSYYRVKIVSVNGKVTYTQVVKVVNGKLQGNISVYPNPIKDGVIHLQLNNQPTGIYKIRLYNSVGQILIFKNIIHTDESSKEEINCNNLPKGIYQLAVQAPNGNEEVIKVIK